MNLNINAIDKKFTKILTIVVSLGIVVYLILKAIPVAKYSFEGVKEEFQDITSAYYTKIVNQYIEEHPDYYFNYEGAVYCIPVQDLIKAGKVTEKNVGDNKNSIIEATYMNGRYVFEYNNECKEK